MPVSSTKSGVGSFCRELLPSPIDVYGECDRFNRNGWAKLKSGCPFHVSKSKRSFFVHRSGGSKCFGCDWAGDMIAFVMKRNGLNFRGACQRLGCWRERGKPGKPKVTQAVPSLVLDFVIDGVQYTAEIVDEPKNDLRVLRRIHAEAKDRLQEIHNGDVERLPGEEEIQWSIMANSWTLIEMELADYVR
jgi:hypothetical protein